MQLEIAVPGKQLIKNKHTTCENKQLTYHYQLGDLELLNDAPSHTCRLAEPAARVRFCGHFEFFVCDARSNVPLYVLLRFSANKSKLPRNAPLKSPS